ncbi:protein FAR1-RELATED SEQUENCE 5-like [Apium graveolens]|uniref:protein FAR1-RELATED SEQUENCE 5-like n=1 Tax=Apium graveolens TaxID=4045 RepID=UPI003D791D0B
MVFYYDYDNNKVIIDGVAYDGPEGEEDMTIALRRIQMALERKKKKKMKLKRRRKSRRKRKTTIRVIKAVLPTPLKFDHSRRHKIIEDKVNDPGKRKTHSDDDVGFGWKNHDVHGDSDDSNDSFNGDDDEKINDENFIGNMNDVVPCVGFEVIIRSSHKHSRNGGISSRLYICRKGGRLGPKPLEVEDRAKGKRPRDVIPRTCCRARMCVAHKVSSNKWEVTKVNLEHNHAMVTSDKVNFMQRSRNIDPFTRSLIELFNKSGIETPKVMNLLSETCGVIEKIGFSAQDVRNVIRDIRRRIFDSCDAECGLVLLRDLQKQSDGNFFYRVDVDEENRVRGLVWVDPRSLNAYKNFGDVVTFDSTYRTNRYDMLFIPITGVNHHYQNILFRFALIRDEKETTYRWVLKTWLEAVDNKPPITIITDQDIALSNAISEVMPNTNHTYCTWHISSKFPEKLSTLYTQYSEFKTDFNACIYKSLSPTEFEGRWEDLKEKYDLENHNWLNDMYAIRRQWVFAFTKQHFAAGMTTTSRSESMNSFFDEYVKASTGLKEFIENSQKALDSQYLREVQADFDTEYKERRLFSNSSMEIHASKIYTKEMFKRFQKELQKSQSFVVKSMKGCGDYLSKMYLVEKSTLPEINRRKFFLKVSIDESYSCTCKKFEHSGMICRHMIRYLNKKQKMMIPPDLVTMRWTINGNKVAGPLPCTPRMLGNVVESQTARYSGLCKAFQAMEPALRILSRNFNAVTNNTNPTPSE